MRGLGRVWLGPVESEVLPFRGKCPAVGWTRGPTLTRTTGRDSLQAKGRWLGASAAKACSPGAGGSLGCLLTPLGRLGDSAVFLLLISSESLPGIPDVFT